jgi:outer membrane protein, multidrug efflux system
MFSTFLRPQRVVALLVGCGMLLLLPACHHIPCLRGADPGAPMPGDFNGMTSPGNSAQLGVSEFYQDPLLTSLVAQALSGNQELKILEEDVQLATNDVILRRGAYLPFGGLRAGAGVEKNSLYTPIGAVEKNLEYEPGKNFPEPLPNLLLSMDFLWQIDIWRELRNMRDAAIQRQSAAIERRNAFVTRMVAEIATNYYELMAADQRLQILDQIIGFQEQSLQVAKDFKAAGRDTELGVQRFQAEVQKNQSEKLIVRQQIVQAENRINFLRGTYPQPVERRSGNFLDVNLQSVQMGIPAHLLQFRPDIRAAEHEVAAAGLEVAAARARFFPRLDLTATVGFEAFEPKYLFDPEAFVGRIAGDLVQPLINFSAIKADYGSANARQLQAIYEYQRVVLNAFTDVVNYLAKAQNYGESVEVKKLQLGSLESSVSIATDLFQNARADYVDVLFSQRDLLEARTVLIETKQQQLAAIVAAYQALGGGLLLSSGTQFPADLEFVPGQLDRGPQLEPVPDEARQDGASIQGESAGRATIAVESIDPAVTPLFDASTDVDKLFDSSVVRPSPTLLRNSDVEDRFDVAPVPGVELEETSPSDGQADQEKFDDAGQDQRRTAAPVNPGDEHDPSRVVELLGHVAVTKSLSSSSGSRKYTSEKKLRPASNEFQIAPATVSR